MSVDRSLAVVFGLFCCGWLVFDMPVALGLIDETTGFYAMQVDPIFRDPPRWLETVGWFALAYGPAYAALTYGYWRSRPWVGLVILPLAGAMFATTGLYFVEELTGDVRPLHWTLFYVLNLPYLAVPPIAAAREIVRRRGGLSRA